MKAQIQRWGESLVLRIPEIIAIRANLRTESEVDLTIFEDKLIVSQVKGAILGLDRLLEGVTPENLQGETDYGLAVGSESW